MYQAAILLAIVVLAMLVGCATPEPAPVTKDRTVTCGILATGSVPLNNGNRVPAMKMVCRESPE